MGRELNISLIQTPTDAEDIIYKAFRQCYSSQFVDDMPNKTVSEKQQFIKNVLETGHTSPIEHVSFTFAIEGISRALSHQLVRHRIASYSQQSQRYVKENIFDYITPPSIQKNKYALEKYQEFMTYANQFYHELCECVKAEDARFVLPNAAETKIVVTMNCRSLFNFFELRCCERAQWEIKNLADRMLSLVKNELPVIFENCGAKCHRLGYCPETKKFSCGKYPTKGEVINRS
jgi:thymidylate synthase (FAD)